MQFEVFRILFNQINIQSIPCGNDQECGIYNDMAIIDSNHESENEADMINNKTSDY
jgi:S-ribosylhomocysteine lyase LuxS involved in autoinducer biosynthesis